MDGFITILRPLDYLFIYFLTLSIDINVALINDTFLSFLTFSFVTISISSMMLYNYIFFFHQGLFSFVNEFKITGFYRFSTDSPVNLKTCAVP